MTTLRVASLLALGLMSGVSAAAAQQRVPPAPQNTQAGPTVQPTKAPDPATVAPRARPAAAQTPVLSAPVRAASKPSLPPDSVRPARAATSTALPRGYTPPAARVPPRAPSATVMPVTSANATVNADAPAPAGATMRCKDGTYLNGTPSNGACGAHGGMAVALPQAPARAPVAPPQPRRP